MNRKSQNAIEFVILSSIMLLVFVVFFILVQNSLAKNNQDKNDFAAQQVINIIVGEIKIAESVTDNYERTFQLPDNINGLDYNISIVNGAGDASELVVVYPDNRQKIYFLEQYISKDSTVGIGYNKIIKNGGNITIKKAQ